MGRLPAPPLSMNRRYVPKSVLPVTSWLLNNEAAVGVAQNAVSAPVWLCAANHCLGDVCVFMQRANDAFGGKSPASSVRRFGSLSSERCP